MKNQEKEYCSDCRQHPKNFERGMGLCIYQKPVTDSLAAIKYKNERKFAQYYLEEIEKKIQGIAATKSRCGNSGADS